MRPKEKEGCVLVTTTITNRDIVDLPEWLYDELGTPFNPLEAPRDSPVTSIGYQH